MQKNIIYWVRNYFPDREGISKEVEMLNSFFENSLIHNWTDTYLINYKRRVFSYHHRYKILIPFFNIYPRSIISNIYCDGTDYLTYLKKRPIILTTISPYLAQSQFYQVLDKIDKIVVESKRDFEKFLSLGIDDEKIILIYPGVNTDQFSYFEPVSRDFNILFASSPFSERYIKLRGLNLLFGACNNSKLFQLIYLGRKTIVNDFVKRETKFLDNIIIINKIFLNMNQIYRQVHATIAPFLTEINNKSCPNSIIESLAAGKPVLVSNKVGIADIIENEKCGIVFEPTQDSLINSIINLKGKYRYYQKNARKVCEKYFSEEQFLKQYETLYESLD